MSAASNVIGVIEHGGIPVPPLPDAVPPAEWRLEAIAAVERPRQPDVRAGRVAFILDRDSSDVWVFDLDPGAPGEVAPQRWTNNRTIAAFWEDTGPRLSPDGSTVAFTNGGAIWLTTGGGVPRKLCEADAPVWIDDQRLVVEVDRPSVDEPNGRTVLGIVAVDSGWVTPLVELEGDLSEVAVSPDGARLAAVHSPRTDLNASRVVIVSLDAADLGAIIEVPGDEHMHDGAPAWSPDGTVVVFRSESPGWNEAFVWEHSERRRLTDEGADFGEFSWSDAGLAAVRTRHGVADLVLIDPMSGEVELVAPGGVWSSPQWTGPASLLAVHEAPDIAPRLVEVTLDAAVEGPVILDRVRPTPAGVRNARHVQPEHLWYSAPGGEVPAFLYRPLSATPDTPCPAIVHPHGGPTSHYGAEWDGVAQYFLDKGYAWLAPNFKGSTSYGRDHERANHGVWGVADTADCLAAHDWLADQDWVAADQIGIFGASYGSYMALLSVVDGDRFACAVAKYGDCDILTSWAQGDRVGRLDLERMMGHPSANPDGYRAGSPIHRIESISAPIFVAHGERDERVHPAQSEELVDALRRIGATYDYVTYPTEGHGLLRREPFLDFYRRLERFLDWYLRTSPLSADREQSKS